MPEFETGDSSSHCPAPSHTRRRSSESSSFSAPWPYPLAVLGGEHAEPDAGFDLFIAVFDWLGFLVSSFGDVIVAPPGLIMCPGYFSPNNPVEARESDGGGRSCRGRRSKMPNSFRRGRWAFPRSVRDRFRLLSHFNTICLGHSTARGDPGHYPDRADAIRLDCTWNGHPHVSVMSQAQPYRGIPRKASDPTRNFNDGLLPLGGRVIACVSGSELSVGHSETKRCYRQLR